MQGNVLLDLQCSAARTCCKTSDAGYSLALPERRSARRRSDASTQSCTFSEPDGKNAGHPHGLAGRASGAGFQGITGQEKKEVYRCGAGGDGLRLPPHGRDIRVNYFALFADRRLGRGEVVNPSALAAAASIPSIALEERTFCLRSASRRTASWRYGLEVRREFFFMRKK